MANRIIEAILKLSAQNRTDAAFKAVARNYDGINRRTQVFNRRQSAMYRTQAATAKQMNAMLLRYAAPAVLVAGASAATREFASLQRRMTRIGINAEASGEQMEGALRRVYDIANDLKAPVDNVIAGFESLVASGKTVSEAMALLPSVAATAHAADADFNEMATTADAIAESFHIAAGEMENAFDIISKGGKEGKFELKDMAAQLPSLAPAFAALGYDGEDGLKRLTAALQTVRKEVGTSSEAATSSMDVISKMNSETIANNFKKFGVDIRKEMTSAKRAGEDTLEAFIRISKEAVDGDLSQLPRLFTDKQMLIGMRALINRTDEYRAMLELLGDSAGTVRGDLKRLAEDAQSDLDRLANSWDRLKQSFGRGIVDMGATDALDVIADDLDKGSAVRKALEKRGMGYMERENWLFRNTFDRDAINQMAMEGGWKPPGSGTGGSSDFSWASNENLAIPRFARDVTGGRIPVPRSKPTGGLEKQILVPPTFGFGSAPPRYGLDPKLEGFYDDPIGLKMQGGGMNVLAEAERKLTAGGDSVAKGGEDAGKSMAEGGREAADAIRSAGQDAAAAIRSAAQARSLGRDVAGPNEL